MLVLDFLDNNVIGRWKYILVSKYKNKLSSSTCSSFGNIFFKDRYIINLGFSKEIENGPSTVFLLDWWCMEHVLQHYYPNLFSITQDIFISVTIVFSTDRKSVV